MEKERELDFFEIGIRSANEHIKILREKAKQIEKKYGKNARLEFESGIAISIPVYDTWIQNNIDMSEIERGGIKR